MELKIDAIIKLMLFAGLGILVFKIGASYFSQFFDNFGSRGNNTHDLDAMIEAKKHMIRTGQFKKTLDTPPPLPTGALGQKPEEQLKNKLNDSLLSEEEKAEIRKILTLYDEAIWGGGVSFDKMAQSFTDLFELKIESGFFMRAFRLANSRHLIHTQKSYKKVEDLILACAFLHKIQLECIEREGPLMTSVAKLCELLPFDIIRSAELLFLRQSKQADLHLYTYLLQTKIDSSSELSRLEQDERDRVLEKLLISPLGNPNELIKKIMEEAHIFASFNPLPELKSNIDLDGAYKILLSSPQSSDEEIKKRYHRLALARHPDRLSGKNIPKKYLEMAHHNFTLIKQALEIISLERKKNA